MRLISTAHFQLEGDPSFSIVEYSHDPNNAWTFIQLLDSGGYPNVILSCPPQKKDKWARAIIAFNAIMEADDGVDA